MILDDIGPLTISIPSTPINPGSYQAFGISLRCNSGKIIIVYRQGDTHQNDAGIIVFRTSTDDGVTWSAAGLLQSEANVDLRNVGGGVTPTGRLVVSWLRWNFTSSIPHTNPTMQFIHSDDEGATWTAPAAFGPDNYSPYGGLIEAGAGKLILPIYNADTSAFMASSDNGSTWTGPTILYSSGAEQPTETSIVYLGNNTLLAVIRRELIPYLVQFKSVDNGATWFSQDSLTFESNNTRFAVWLTTFIAPIGGKRAAAMYYYDRDDGIMRVIFAYADDVIAGPSAWNYNSMLNIFIGGAQGVGGYPSVVQDPNSANAVGWFYNQISSTQTSINFFKISAPNGGTMPVTINASGKFDTVPGGDYQVRVRLEHTDGTVLSEAVSTTVTVPPDPVPTPTAEPVTVTVS